MVQNLLRFTRETKNNLDLEEPVPKTNTKPWYADGRRLIRRMDRWVSRKQPQPEIGQESEWLGWDGWVRTDNGPGSAGGTTNAG